MGIGAGRRGDLPGVHVLRDGRGDRPARRDARLRRHRPGDAEPRPRGRRRAGSRRGRRRSCRCTCSAGRRRSPSSPRSASRSSRTPRRRSAPPASRTTGVASTFSFFPTKNLFGLGDGGLVAATDDGARRPRAACSASTARATRSTSSSSATTRGSTSSRRRRCGSSCRTSTGWNAPRREAAARYAELGLGELCELPADDARPRLPHVRRPHARARPHRRGADGGRDRLRLVLRDAAPSPAGAALPRLARQGRCPRPSGPSRENLALPMWAGIDAEHAGAGRRGRSAQAVAVGAA